MTKTRRNGTGGRLLAVAAWVLAGAGPAFAQEAAPAQAPAGAADAEVQSLRDELRQLGTEFRSFRAEVAAKEAREAEAKASAGPVAVGVDGSPRTKPVFEPHVQMHNLLLYRNDTDFDRRKPLYDENGQTVGAFATVFGPVFQWNLTDRIRLVYEAEVGLNYWSKNNPDQENALGNDIFVLKHRQIFSEGTLADGRFGFKVGYQYFTDTTALFLGHWIGAAQAWYEWAPERRIGLFVGMVPDSTFEGLNVQMNNFAHDIFTFGARTDLRIDPNWRIDAAVHGLYDTHRVHKRRWLVAPNAHVEGTSGWVADGKLRVTGALDGVLQAGRSENTRLDGGDQDLLAWAVQGRLTLETKPVLIRLNLLALSADDAWQGNDREGGFFYSSKSTSSTMYFTEDETRNWYDQLDRRLGTFEGGFWQHRAGLLLGDLALTLQLLPWFRPTVVLGYGAVLEPANALGERQLGFEGNLDLAFQWTKHLVARVIVGGMQPGKAAGGLINEIAPQDKATDALWWTEAALSLVF